MDVGRVVKLSHILGRVGSGHSAGKFGLFRVGSGREFILYLGSGCVVSSRVAVGRVNCDRADLLAADPTSVT